MVWLVKPAIQLLVVDKMKLLLKTTGIPDTELCTVFINSYTENFDRDNVVLSQKGKT